MKVVIRDDILHIEEGLLFKRRTDIPLAKITSITSSGILAKTWTVAGAGTVKIIRGRSHDAVMKLALQKQPSQMQRDVITQKEVVKIRCSHCRTMNLDTSMTCANCGARL